MNTATEPTPHKTPVVSLYKRYKKIAAVLILVIGVSAVFMVFKNQRNITNTAAITPVKSNTAQKLDTQQKTAPPANPGITAANAFAQYYKPYTSNNDPVEASVYYQYYKQGRYTDILAATDADMQIMGGNDNKEQLSQYLQLYKGLAYLAENKPAKAQQQFDTVIHASNKTTPQYYEAQWYSCMTFLKLGDVNKAGLLAEIIAQTSLSPYKTKAEGLVVALGVK